MSSPLWISCVIDRKVQQGQSRVSQVGVGDTPAASVSVSVLSSVSRFCGALRDMQLWDTTLQMLRLFSSGWLSAKTWGEKHGGPDQVTLVCMCTNEALHSDLPGAESLPKIFFVKLFPNIKTSHSSLRQKCAWNLVSVKLAEKWPCDCFWNNKEEERQTAGKLFRCETDCFLSLLTRLWSWKINFQI